MFLAISVQSSVINEKNLVHNQNVDSLRGRWKVPKFGGKTNLNRLSILFTSILAK